ncbi:MAG: hypothetical protein PUI24_10420 [Spirochaetales bacterium]|nr:hypothetical protein [Spirochaetales bacterium]
MDRWEYRRGDAIGQDLKELNALGKEGWETVGYVQGSVLLKRKIPTAPTQTVQRPVQNNKIDDDFGIPF